MPNDQFEDTRLVEPDEDIYYDTSEKIMALSDQLAEEIILENIGDQLDAPLETLNDRVNYVSLFREKYSAISPSDPYYDEEYLKESLSKVAQALNVGIYNRYGVELGEDLDFTTPAQYFFDMETLYEFLLIRHKTNLVDFLNKNLQRNRQTILATYTEKLEEEPHINDIFVTQSKKKFKHKDDLTILHFLSDILMDIRDGVTSAYDLFREIVDYDIYEEFNYRMSEMLINYGNKIVLNNDYDSAKKYLAPLHNPSLFSEIKNEILVKYLETVEVVTLGNDEDSI